MPPPPHDDPHGPPTPPHARHLGDGARDEDVLRFAPPEIRRIWKRLVSVEEKLDAAVAALARVEALLERRDR